MLADRATGEPEGKFQFTKLPEEKHFSPGEKYHLKASFIVQTIPVDKKVGMVAYEIQLATNNQNNGNKINGIKRIEY